MSSHSKINNNSLADIREDTDPTDPDAAPLEQNIKNLECNGIHYKVVREDDAVPLPHNMPIAESRNHAKRMLDRAMAKGKKKKQLKGADACHALNPGINSAFEENLAEERFVRLNQHIEEFQSRVCRRITKKEEFHKVT